MKKRYSLIFLITNFTMAGMDSSVQIQGNVSKEYKSREFISIKDGHTPKAYVVPLKKVRFLDKKKGKVVVEMTDGEFKSARKKCMSSKKLKKSLCPPQI